MEGGYRIHNPTTLRVGPHDLPLVSVVTVVYNGEKFLEQTILSVLGQTYPHLEYIIIDGGSTDGTLDIIRKYEDRIAYWKSEPDKGISDAFNKGISAATGRVVGILNADDWYEPDTVATVAENFKPNSVVHGNLQYWQEDGAKSVLVAPNQKLLNRAMTINHPTAFVDRDLYLKYGVYSLDYRLAMDYHLLLRLFQNNANFVYVYKTLANMRFGGSSANWIASYREVKKAKDEILGTGVSHTCMFWWQVMKRYTSEYLDKTPFAWVKRVYRRHLSSMHKV